VKFLLDAQLPPALARWLADNFGVEVGAVRDLGLRDAREREIFARAKTAQTVVITKDSDFVELVHRLGSPPQVVWLTCGNVSNSHLQRIFTATFPDALQLLSGGETIVEISDK
jgi:predicted nuclease of predicted toxin-antitoxin system